MATLDAFLATMPPLRAAKARNALAMHVCVNGGGHHAMMTRAALIEDRVARGATVVSKKTFGDVLMLPDGCFLDRRNATATGLDYARFLIALNPEPERTD